MWLIVLCSCNYSRDHCATFATFLFCWSNDIRKWCFYWWWQKTAISRSQIISSKLHLKQIQQKALQWRQKEHFHSPTPWWTHGLINSGAITAVVSVKNLFSQFLISNKHHNTEMIYCVSDSKESTCSAGDLGSVPGSGRSPGGGHGNPLQYSCLENPHGQRSLADYSLWGPNELYMTERISTTHKIIQFLILPWG